MIYADDEKELEFLLTRLPWAYQVVIQLLVLDRRSYESAAKTLHCTIEAVRTRYHRAIRALSKVVREEGIKEQELRRWLFADAFMLYKDNPLRWADVSQARNIL